MKASSIVICLFVLLSVSTLATVVSFKDCLGLKDPYFNLDKMDVKPWPMKKGKDVSATMFGQALKNIKSGSAKITAKAMGVEVFQQNKDICSLVKCPMTPQEYDITTSISIPGYAPQIPVTIFMEGFGPSGEKLFCYSVDGTITSAIEEEDEDIEVE
eukprot:scpid107978/ scgid19422/ 